jgi:hypothetical protein
MEKTVSAMLLLLGLYGSAGLICALWLHARGLKRIDPAVEGAGIFFRLLITPGLVALWPLLMARWQGKKQDREVLGSVHRPLEAAALRRIQAWLAWGLALLLPAAVAAALLMRPAPASSHVESPPGHPARLPQAGSATPLAGPASARP